MREMYNHVNDGAQNSAEICEGTSTLFLHKSLCSYFYFKQKQSAMLLDIPNWYLL